MLSCGVAGKTRVLVSVSVVWSEMTRSECMRNPQSRDDSRPVAREDGGRPKVTAGDNGEKRKSERRKGTAGLYRQRQQSPAKSERETKLDRVAWLIVSVKSKTMAWTYRARCGKWANVTANKAMTMGHKRSRKDRYRNSSFDGDFQKERKKKKNRIRS